MHTKNYVQNVNNNKL